MRQLILTVLITIMSVCILSEKGQCSDYFALEDLHLISWEHLPYGHPTHTGPVSTAVLMAWYATHGYPQLLSDLNYDGEISEDDTVLLAQQFAEEMAADDREGVFDPFVVDVLATYIGENCADEFILLIFDPSFADEYRIWMNREYDPDRYPGVEIILLQEPDLDTYVGLLEDYHPGIVGCGMEPEPNRYSVSRSHERSVDDDEGPVDLVNTDRSYFGPEPVWETELRMGGELWWFTSPEWTPFEILIVPIPRDEDAEAGDSGVPDDSPDTPPGGTPSGGTDGESTPPPGDSSWGHDESSDLTIVVFNSGLEPFDVAQNAPGEQVRHLLQVWHTGPHIPRNVVVELTIPFGVQIDWVGGNPAEMTGWPGRHFVWSVPEGSLQVAHPSLGMTPGVDVWLEGFQITVDESICTTLELACEVSSTTLDPNLSNNVASLMESFGSCNGDSNSGTQPPPSTLPNLWVTNMTGCWEWSGDGREHVMATVTGIVHNGGQAAASSVRVCISAGGETTSEYVGTISAGSQRRVSATIDIGPYDRVSWAVPTSITADPGNLIQEADESNNMTRSSFPESSECD